MALTNKQTESDDVAESVFQFVNKYSDMYNEKYGFFAGDDLIFIDAAQYYGISVLDAIYKYRQLSNKQFNISTNLSESHEKLIAFWNMLDHGLKQDEYYTWQYRGRPIRLGEIPPLPLSMQKPMPDPGKEIEVDFKLNIKADGIHILTNLPDNYQFYGKINSLIDFRPLINDFLRKMAKFRYQ